MWHQIDPKTIWIWKCSQLGQNRPLVNVDVTKVIGLSDLNMNSTRTGGYFWLWERKTIYAKQSRHHTMKIFWRLSRVKILPRVGKTTWPHTFKSYPVMVIIRLTKWMTNLPPSCTTFWLRPPKEYDATSM
jgi:hypothetical protein